MLKLVGEQEADRIVAFLDDKGAIAARICAYIRCYRTLMNDIYFWSQDNNGEISAVISRVDGNMTVYADGRADFDEISEFLRIINKFMEENSLPLTINEKELIIFNDIDACYDVRNKL